MQFTKDQILKTMPFIGGEYILPKNLEGAGEDFRRCVEQHAIGDQEITLHIHLDGEQVAEFVTSAIHGAWTAPKPAAPSTDDDAPSEEAQRTQDQYLLNNPKAYPCRVCGGVHPYATRQCTAVPVKKDDLPQAQTYLPGSGKAPISDGEAEYLGEQLRSKGEQPFTRGESRRWRFDQDVNALDLQSGFTWLIPEARGRDEQFERELVELCDDSLVALELDFIEYPRAGVYAYSVMLTGDGDRRRVSSWVWDQWRVLEYGRESETK